MANRRDPMGMGLAMLNRIASSEMIDKLGLRKATERAVYQGAKSGFQAVGAASRTFKKAKGSGKPSRLSSHSSAGVYDLNPTEDQEMIVAVVKEFAEEAGRQLPKDYVFACFIYTALFDDEKEARQWGVKELSYRYDQDFSELVDKYCAYGSPERVKVYLSKYIEAGCNYFILAPIMPPDKRRQHLERYAAEVIPELSKLEPRRIV